MALPALTGARSASRASAPSRSRVEAAAEAKCLRPQRSNFPPAEPEPLQAFPIARLPYPAALGSILCRKILLAGGECNELGKVAREELPLRLALKAGNGRVAPVAPGDIAIREQWSTASSYRTQTHARRMRGPPCVPRPGRLFSWNLSLGWSGWGPIGKPGRKTSQPFSHPSVFSGFVTPSP
jgi:hypothetical protein